MRQLRRRNKGFSIISIIMVLAIIGILSQNYFSTDTPTGEAWVGYQQSRVQAAVQSANLGTARTQFFMQTEGRPQNINQLRPILDNLSRSMGGGGRYFVVGSSQDLKITTGIETRPFSDMMNLARDR
ncbi:MAG: hypothetical protein JJU11_09320 [Candidatus Sumerlaeia bacterium]|nr:hypothetical protein [Candidatus Sumerlaeia bacterium]